MSFTHERSSGFLCIFIYTMEGSFKVKVRWQIMMSIGQFSTSKPSTYLMHERNQKGEKCSWKKEKERPGVLWLAWHPPSDGATKMKSKFINPPVESQIMLLASLSPLLFLFCSCLFFNTTILHFGPSFFSPLFLTSLIGSVELCPDVFHVCRQETQAVVLMPGQVRWCQNHHQGYLSGCLSHLWI